LEIAALERFPDEAILPEIVADVAVKNRINP
jgi:hypothetical protein